MSTDPSVYVIDTPGIMPPKLEDVTAGLRMALACMDGVRWGKGEAVALTHHVCATACAQPRFGRPMCHLTCSLTFYCTR